MFDGLSDEQILIIDFIGKIADSDKSPPTENQIRGFTKLNITKNKYALEELLDFSYIRKSYDDEGDEVYELTNKGLNVYIELSTP